MSESVFFCHARQDRDPALAIVERLRAAGASVWVDEGRRDDPLRRGQRIVEAISGCRVVCALISSAAVRSVNVQRELALAVEEEKPVVALYLEPLTVPSGMRYALAGVPPVELFGGEAEGRLGEALRSLQSLGVECTAPPLPEPTPAPPRSRARRPRTPTARTTTPSPLVISDSPNEDIARLEETLRALGCAAQVRRCVRGPAITRYEVEPAAGVRTSRLARRADDLALAFGALDVRVELPAPGQSCVGIEVPRPDPVIVPFSELAATEAFAHAESPLAFVLGRDLAGNVVVADLARLPHLLVAGAANAGKTTCLQALIASLVLRSRPEGLRLVLIDPKRVAFAVWDGIPHLFAPVLHSPGFAMDALRQVVREMERRYELLASVGVRNLREFNALDERPGGAAPLPYLVVVIDELADLMMTAAAETELSLCRLAQLGRAPGIHLAVATARPSPRVISGTLKANIPARIALAVGSAVDSRAILDTVGAERLTGRGDLLYQSLDDPRPVRLQGAWVPEAELHAIAEGTRQYGAPGHEFAPDIEDTLPPADVADDLYEQAAQLVAREQQASASFLQRRLLLGYSRARRLLDMLEAAGVVGPPEGARSRTVLVPPPGGPGSHSDGNA